MVTVCPRNSQNIPRREKTARKGRAERHDRFQQGVRRRWTRDSQAVTVDGKHPNRAATVGGRIRINSAACKAARRFPPELTPSGGCSEEPSTVVVSGRAPLCFPPIFLFPKKFCPLRIFRRGAWACSAAHKVFPRREEGDKHAQSFWSSVPVGRSFGARIASAGGGTGGVAAGGGGAGAGAAGGRACALRAGAAGGGGIRGRARGGDSGGMPRRNSGLGSALGRARRDGGHAADLGGGAGPRAMASSARWTGLAAEMGRWRGGAGGGAGSAGAGRAAGGRRRGAVPSRRGSGAGGRGDRAVFPGAAGRDPPAQAPDARGARRRSDSRAGGTGGAGRALAPGGADRGALVLPRPRAHGRRRGSLHGPERGAGDGAGGWNAPARGGAGPVRTAGGRRGGAEELGRAGGAGGGNGRVRADHGPAAERSSLRHGGLRGGDGHAGGVFPARPGVGRRRNPGRVRSRPAGAAAAGRDRAQAARHERRLRRAGRRLSRPGGHARRAGAHLRDARAAVRGLLALSRLLGRRRQPRGALSVPAHLRIGGLGGGRRGRAAVRRRAAAGRAAPVRPGPNHSRAAGGSVGGICEEAALGAEARRGEPAHLSPVYPGAAAAEGHGRRAGAAHARARAAGGPGARGAGSGGTGGDGRDGAARRAADGDCGGAEGGRAVDARDRRRGLGAAEPRVWPALRPRRRARRRGDEVRAAAEAARVGGGRPAARWRRTCPRATTTSCARWTATG